MTANEILGDTTDIWELFLVSESCYTMFDQPKNAKVSWFVLKQKYKSGDLAREYGRTDAK